MRRRRTAKRPRNDGKRLKGRVSWLKGRVGWLKGRVGWLRGRVSYIVRLYGARPGGWSGRGPAVTGGISCSVALLPSWNSLP